MVDKLEIQKQKLPIVSGRIFSVYLLLKKGFAF